MSITRGPTVPPSTGSSTDLPVSLSVKVIVPVVILFPSIDAPHSLCLAVAGFSRKISIRSPLGKPFAGARLPTPSAAAGGGIRHPAECFRPAENLHHDEDAGRGCRPGQGGPQWLRHDAELDSF